MVFFQKNGIFLERISMSLEKNAFSKKNGRKNACYSFFPVKKKGILS